MSDRNGIPGYGSLSPWQQLMANRILAGSYDFTYGPGSPNPTREDLRTIYGNTQNRLQTRNYAVPQSVYDSFTPAQRAALGISDIAPEWHGSRLERFFGKAVGTGKRYIQSIKNAIPFAKEGIVKGGPFQGWTREAVQQWHSGPGPAQLGYPSFTGNTAGPGGEQLAYSTTSYNVPGYGWVPQAQLANPQASNVLSDYFGTKGGAGTGVPTAKAVGTIGGTLSNFVLPGSGFLVGPALRAFTRMLQRQGGGYKQQVRQALNRGGTSSVGPLEDVTTGGGGGWSPFGGLPPGFTEERNRLGEFGAPNFPSTNPAFNQGPQWTGGSIFNNNQGPFLGGAFQSPPGGSIGGPLGTGSHGNLGSYWGGIVQRAYDRGDPSMGFGGPNDPIIQFGQHMGYTPRPSFNTLAPYLRANQNQFSGGGLQKGPNARVMRST